MIGAVRHRLTKAMKYPTRALRSFRALSLNRETRINIIIPTYLEEKSIMTNISLLTATAKHQARYVAPQDIIVKGHLAAASQHMVAAYDPQRAAHDVPPGNHTGARRFSKTAERYSETIAEISDDVSFLYEDWNS
jgi:hypothetical protein